MIYQKSRSALLKLMLVNILALSFAFVFGGENYSVDGYKLALKNYQGHVEWFAASYRFFAALLFKCLYPLGYDPIKNATPSVWFYIIITGTATSWLTWKLKKVFFNRNVIVIDIAVLISCVNCWYCDILSFPECIVILTIGTVLTFFAIGLIAEEISLLRCFASVISLICATGIFQQFFCLFAVYAIAICCKRIEDNRDGGLKNVIATIYKPLSVWVISGVGFYSFARIGVALANVEPNERTSNGISELIENGLHIIRNGHSYVKGRGFFETEILTLCFCITTLLFIGALAYRIFIEKKTGWYILFLSVCAVFCSILAALLSGNRGTRAMFPLFAMYGFAALVAPRGYKSLSRKGIASVLLVVLLLNVSKTVECEINLKKINTLDNLWAKHVVTEIKEYEQNTGIRVKKVVVSPHRENEPGVFMPSYTQSATEDGYICGHLLNLKADRKDLEVVISEEFFGEETVFDNQVAYVYGNIW